MKNIVNAEDITLYYSVNSSLIYNVASYVASRKYGDVFELAVDESLSIINTFMEEAKANGFYILDINNIDWYSIKPDTNINYLIDHKKILTSIDNLKNNFKEYIVKITIDEENNYIINEIKLRYEENHIDKNSYQIYRPDATPNVCTNKNLLFTKILEIMKVSYKCDRDKVLQQYYESRKNVYEFLKNNGYDIER